MSLRRLRVLVQNLPPDSAVVRAIRKTHWTDQEYLLAHIVDHLSFYRYEFAKANGASPRQPEPTRRPGDDPDQGRELVRTAHDHVMAQLRGE